MEANEITARGMSLPYFYVSFAVVYGFFVNYVDLLGLSRSPHNAFQVWLIGLYFAPFVSLLMERKARRVELFIALGILVSLMNDLFYYPAGYTMMVDGRTNLITWWAQQLGFAGSKVVLDFNAGVATIPITSVVMGASIYLRVVACAVLFWLVRNRG